MMAKGLDTYLTNAPLDRKDPLWVAWKVEDDRIRLRLWNSVKPQISSSLIYLITTKQVWDQAKEIFFFGNLCHTYDHQILFSHSW